MKKIIFFGCHSGGLLAFKYLLNSEFRISHVLCLSPEQGDKYAISGYLDYTPFAKENNIPFYYPQKYDLKDKKDFDFFKTGNFDLLIQGGWQRLFPEDILNLLNIGALGLHGSCDPLPKGRGRSPMNWSIIENRKRFLMHLFLIDKGTDSGEVIDILDFDINNEDDIETLYLKYNISYKELLEKNLRNILEGSFDLRPQIGSPSYYRKREPSDGYINWEDMDIYFINRLIKAVTYPYPGAYSEINKRKIRIWKSRIFDTRIRFDEKMYGEIVYEFEKKIIIKCRGGLLLLDQWDWET